VRMTAVAVVSAVLVSAAWAEPDSVTLRLHHQAGQTITYRASVSGTGSISMLGEQQLITVRGRFTRVERTLSQVGAPTAVAPPTWQVTVSIEEPSLTFRAGADEQTLAMQVPALTEIVNDRGAVSEVSGWEHALAAPGAPGTPGMGDAVRPLFALIPQEGLPAGAVKPGDTWTARAKLRMPDGSEQEVTQSLEFLGFEDVGGVPCARIRSAADIPVRRELPANAIGMQVKVEGTQRIETTSWFAHEQGLLLRQQVSTALDLKTSTLLSADTPDAVAPGAISLRVRVTLDLQP